MWICTQIRAETLASEAVQGFTLYKAEQPLLGMDLQEKEKGKDE